MPTKETAGDATHIGHGSVPSESIKDQQTIERTLSISENLSLARGKSMPLIDTPPFGSFETILGPVDRRKAVVTPTASPWNMICSLRIRTASGRLGIGTGWIAGPRTIITAGHCVYSTVLMDGWAQSIEVRLGFDNGSSLLGSYTSTTFDCLPAWKKFEMPEFDIGYIRLGDDINPTIGSFAIAALTDAELQDELVHIAGYPGDLSNGARQYHHGNRIKHTDPKRIFYDIDTYEGQSGSPVWLYRDGTPGPVVVGTHAYGVDSSLKPLSANSGPRITAAVMTAMQGWI